jgi:hypothetical protein
MPGKLRNTTAKVSFFSFQDMITTVTGVLLLITLMMSTHLGQPADDSARQKARQELEEATNQLQKAQGKLSELQAQLSAQATSVFVIPEPDPDGRRVVLIVLSATNGLCSGLGQSNLTDFPVGDNQATFKNLLTEQWSPATHRLVFYVQPSGIAHFVKCSQLAKDHGFTIGYDAAEEGKNYVFTPPASPAKPSTTKGPAGQPDSRRIR